MLVLVCALHDAMNNVDPNHLEVERLRVLRLGIDRNKVVLAGHLQAMAGIKEDANVRDFSATAKSRTLRSKATLSRSSPSITSKPCFLKAAAMSTASFLGLMSFGVC